MTRIEIYETLQRLGYTVRGLPNNQMRIRAPDARAESVISEKQALAIIEGHRETHCLHCGRPYTESKNGKQPIFD